MDLKRQMTDYTLSICNIPSPSGFTKQAEEYLVRELSSMGYSPYQTRKGNVVCALGGEGRPLILAAHVDTLGAMVRSIKANGRLRMTPIGGYPFNNVENETCKVYARDGRVYTGTIYLTSPSVHVYKNIGDIKRDDTTVELVLDELVSSKEEVSALGIGVGCFISFDPRATATLTGFIKSRHLDDKASTAVLLSLAGMVQRQEVRLARKVYLVFTVHEEVGHGAATGMPEDAEEILSVDMGCVGDDLECDETMVSICAKDSPGAYNYEIVSKLIGLAKENGLKYAVDIYPNYSSDADASLRAGYDYRHGLIGPGVFASHGYERTHVEGLYNTLMLLRGYVESGI